MHVATMCKGRRKGDKRTTKQMREDLLQVMVSAKQNDYLFLLYLLGMAMQEMGNIEKGQPTPFSGMGPILKKQQSPEQDE